MTTTRINALIKKEVIRLMGKGQESYSKKITKNNELYLEQEITINYESTCRIGVLIDYKILANFNKEDNTISLIQTN
jgi:hypothetical protein